ncbi:MAG: serine hydrolase [Bacteroidota bacterium]|nr:serine hydrolase [Bacteroidota bacterium]
MRIKGHIYIVIALLFGLNPLLKAQSTYFPPSFSTNWDTVHPSSIGWCQNKVDSLTQYVGNTNAKAFIILKGGKIALEQYYGTFTMDSLWFWASAGKSLASVMIGKAQQDGILNINDSTSHYLGAGWTSCTSAQEGAITLKDQLQMTTGLNDNVPNQDCTVDTCLIYLSDAGTRWAYHNAPYHLLHDVIEQASGLTLQQYTNQKIKTPTGMGSGFWFDHVYYSKPRDMARFGLLCAANGNWNGTPVLSDPTYLNDMKNTSNPHNLSYGYLWWLNGKSSFMVPQTQFVFTGSLIPNAPADMYCALGKYDQKIYIVPSLDIVVVRMGNAGSTAALAISAYDNVLWEKIMDMYCTTSIETRTTKNINMFPNPASDVVYIESDNFNANEKISVTDILGKNWEVSITKENTSRIKIDVSGLSKGVYFIKGNQWQQKVVIE